MKYNLLYCMGDSFSVGAAQADDINSEVTIDNRFSNLVANHYGLHCINNASGGASNKYIARILYNDVAEFIKKGINPLVLVSYTEHSRNEIYSNIIEGAVTISTNSVSFYKDYIVDHYNDQYSLDCTNYYIDSIKALLSYKNIDFVDAFVFHHEGYNPHISRHTELDKTFCDMAMTDRFILDPINGDLGHPTAAGHKKIADAFIKKIETLYGTK